MDKKTHPNYINEQINDVRGFNVGSRASPNESTEYQTIFKKNRPSLDNIDNIDDISPEMAALIVKKFILPMFESDGKKLLKGPKHLNKMAGIGALTGKNLKAGQFQKDPNTVYGELKLSEKLQSELTIVRDRVNFLNEQLEQAIYERDAFKRQVGEVRQLLTKKERELQKARRMNMNMA